MIVINNSLEPEMRYFILGLASLLISTIAFADTYVSGYYRSDGTYVAPHYRSSPNSTKSDNWSQSGNVNPYTGKRGTLNCGYNCANNSFKY